jgi:hypothetical protein
MRVLGSSACGLPTTRTLNVSTKPRPPVGASLFRQRLNARPANRQRNNPQALPQIAWGFTRARARWHPNTTRE